MKTNSISPEEKIRNEFFIFFKNLQTIFEMYNLSYNQNLDNDFIEKEKKKIKLIGKLINLFKKKRQTKIDKEKIELYRSELSQINIATSKKNVYKKLEFNGKQTIISIINNFELFRKKLISIAFKNFKNAEDKYIHTFNNCAVNHFKKTGDTRFNTVREFESILPKNLKLIESQKKLSSVEKLMYDIDTKDEKIRNIYNKSYKVYIIYREVRNMLTHRENKTDEILFKSLKSSIPSKMLQPEEDFSKFYETLLISGYKKTGDQLLFTPHTISILLCELLNLAFIYCISLTKKNVFHEEIATIYNDMLIDYSNKNQKNSYANFFMGNVFDLFTEINKTDDPVFLVNSILVFDMKNKHFGGKNHKFYENKIKIYLERIKKIDKKKYHYDIIKAFLTNSNERLFKLTESTDRFLKESKRGKSDLRDWYIFKILKNEFYIMNYLKE